jgi:hypothetical protein
MTLWPIKYWDPCMRGHLHRPRDFCSCEASPSGCLQAACSQRGFYPVLERWDPNSPGIQEVSKQLLGLENGFHWEYLKK